MTDESELSPDSIVIPDDEKVIFSDAPKGGEKQATEEPATPPAGDPPLDAAAPEGVDGEGQPDGEAETPEQREARRVRKRKTLQERVSELTRLRHEAEEREAAALARNELLEAQARELQERHQRATTENLTQRETDLVARKKQALEENDMAAYDAASTELLDLKLQTRAVERPVPAPQRQTPPADDDMHPAAKAWVTRNDWYSKPENKHLASEALRIEARLRRDGAQIGDELYAKLDEAIAELPDFDEVRGVRTDDDPPAAEPPPTGRPVVTPPSRGAEPPPAKPRAGALTEADKQTMRRFKLDPNKPEHRETYLKYKS